MGRAVCRNQPAHIDERFQTQSAQSGSYVRVMGRRLDRHTYKIAALSHPNNATTQAFTTWFEVPIGMRNQGSANGICNMLLRPSKSLRDSESRVDTRASAVPNDHTEAHAIALRLRWGVVPPRQRAG